MIVGNLFHTMVKKVRGVGKVYPNNLIIFISSIKISINFAKYLPKMSGTGLALGPCV